MIFGGQKAVRTAVTTPLMPRTHISVSPVCSGRAATKQDGDLPCTETFMLDATNLESSAKRDVASNVPPCTPDEPSSSQTSLHDSDADLCRICHCESERDAPLLAPCVCAGSVRYVHQACLQQWIQSADTRSCELCKYEFHMTTKLKPICEWRWLDMNAIERRKVFCSVLFHAIAITCVIWSLYVLIERTTEEMRSGSLQWQFWTKLVVVAVGFAGGLIFMYVQCRMYVQLCRRWRAYNRVIFVGPFAGRAATPHPVLTVKGDGGQGKHPLPPDEQTVTHIV